LKFNKIEAKPAPIFCDFFQTFASMHHGISVKELDERMNPIEKNIDLRLVIANSIALGNENFQFSES
jgi:hypothetical protein